MGSVILIVIMTLMISSLTDDAINNGINSNTLPQEAEITLDAPASFFNTYWKLLSFNGEVTATDAITDEIYVVLEIPMIISLIFLVANIASGLIILETLIEAVKALPFT
jgi:hypothetical protein